MMRNTTRQKRFVNSLKGTAERLDVAGPWADTFEEFLPQIAADKAAAKAIITETKAIEREIRRASQRVRRLAERVARLAVRKGGANDGA